MIGDAQHGARRSPVPPPAPDPSPPPASTPAGEAARRAVADHDEPQSLFHTGGATGPPKLVRHGQRCYQALFLRGQFYRARGDPGGRHLSVSSFATTNGQMPSLLALFQGGAAVLMTDIGAAELLSTIERERVTSTLLSPPRLHAVLTEPAPGHADCSSLRSLNVGGSAVPVTDLAQAIERFGPVLRVVYGMTEMPIISDNPGMALGSGHPERLRAPNPVRPWPRSSSGRRGPASRPRNCAVWWPVNLAGPTRRGTWSSWLACR